MPTYEYRCPDGHTFEKFYRNFSEAGSSLPCPVCGRVADRIVSGGAGLLFKGSGFYITDYGKDGKKDERAAAKRTAKSDTSSAERGSGESGSSEGTGASPTAGSSDQGKGADKSSAATPAAPTAKSKPAHDE